MGTDGCACTSSLTCDLGLVCASQVCRGPSPGAAAGSSADSVSLEPFRAPDITFAKPKGLLRKGNDARVYVFEAPNLDEAPITGFQVGYLGHIRSSQVPSALQVLEKVITSEKLTSVGTPASSPEYATSLVDTGKPGPFRYARISALRHWKLVSEGVAAVHQPPPLSLDLLLLQISFPDSEIDEKLKLPYLLKSIAWGVALPPDTLSLDELSGTWESSSGGFPSDAFTSEGIYTGSFQSGSLFRIALDQTWTYDLLTSFSVSCAGVPGCVLEGIATTSSRGRYLAEGGTITFEPSRCQYRFYDRNVQLKTMAGCSPDMLPATLRMGRGPRGGLSVGGLGTVPVNADQQKLLHAARKGGPGGTWDAPVEGPPRPVDETFNICGLSESEPNDEPTQATPVVAQQRGCLPTSQDVDLFRATAPASDLGGGYYEGSLSSVNALSLEVYPGADLSASNRLLAASTGRGDRTYFYWPGAPGQTYTLRLNTASRSWCAYDLDIAYHKVDDAFEVNDTIDQATPIAVGSPVDAFFFAGKRPGTPPINYEDWYSFQLHPGLATIRIDVPADIAAGVKVIGPSGSGPERYVFNSSPGEDYLLAGFTVMTSGTYRVRLTYVPAPGGVAIVRGMVPPSFTTPYRLLVTQP